ncbi:MAG: hypothetical protein ACREHD_31190 [Pirellulales bacterium]
MECDQKTMVESGDLAKGKKAKRGLGSGSIIFAVAAAAQTLPLFVFAVKRLHYFRCRSATALREPKKQCVAVNASVERTTAQADGVVLSTGMNPAEKRRWRHAARLACQSCRPRAQGQWSGGLVV